MSSRPFVLITGDPSDIAAAADCFARGGTDARPLERTGRRTRAAFQREIRLDGQRQADLKDDIRLAERAHIIHELHDTLLQGFLGASILLDQAVEQTPADSPSMPALSRALRLARQAIDEGRAAIRGVHTASRASSSLEQAFSNLISEVTTGRGLRLRIFVQGEPRTLNPAIREQLFLIGREAVMNALRHSQATEIEVEVQYLRTLLRVSVRDNGCGINPEAVQKECDLHWGLRGMRERAANIGARFGIWSRIGAGTEVRVAVSVDVAKQPRIAVWPLLQPVSILSKKYSPNRDPLSQRLPRKLAKADAI